MRRRVDERVRGSDDASAGRSMRITGKITTVAASPGNVVVPVLRQTSGNLMTSPMWLLPQNPAALTLAIQRVARH